MTSENHTFTVILSLQDDGGYSVVCPALPGCVSQGDNRREALENIREAGAEDERSVGSSRMRLPHPETSDLIIDEIRCILADRDADDLPYGGVSTERVEFPSRLQCKCRLFPMILSKGSAWLERQLGVSAP